MQAEQQYSIRYRYAESRRKKSFKFTPRVIWKSKSRFVA